MPESFEAKLRKVGSSAGFLVPSEVLEKEHLKIGERLTVTVIKPRTRKELEKLVRETFGIAKGTRPFVREHEAWEREF